MIQNIGIIKVWRKDAFLYYPFLTHSTVTTNKTEVSTIRVKIAIHFINTAPKTTAINVFISVFPVVDNLDKSYRLQNVPFSFWAGF